MQKTLRKNQPDRIIRCRQKHYSSSLAGKQQTKHSMPSIKRQTGAANSDTLGVTAFLSATLHAVLILGLGFAAPQFMSTDTIDNSLDVVLINQSNKIDPVDADLVAQATNAGGGVSPDEASTPVPWKQVNASKVEQVALQAKTQETVERVAEEILTTPGKSEFSALIKKDEKEQEERESDQELTTKQQIKLEKERLAAKIAESWSEYNKRPKREFYSPNAKKSDSAAYVKNWQNKVERIGQNNFPNEIRRKKLNGTLIVDVAINKDGTIKEINVIKSSGNKLLDDTTIKFIRMASPYRAFDESMSERIDIIHITRAYFLSGKKIISQAITQ